LVGIGHALRLAASWRPIAHALVLEAGGLEDHVPVTFKTRVLSQPDLAKVPTGQPSVDLGLAPRELSRLVQLINETELERVPTSQLRPSQKNARKHPTGQIDLIARNIEAFGFTNPILVDQTNTVICGHGRLAAALQLKLPEVPIIRLTHLPEKEARALALADNRLSELAVWDNDILAEELSALNDLSAELSFDLDILGFDLVEPRRMRKRDATRRKPHRHTASLADRGLMDPSACRGDVWQCGDHFVACADPREGAAYAAVLGQDLVNVLITEPLDVSLTRAEPAAKTAPTYLASPHFSH
jgi:hypothetical protein